mmetsp:Transcript_67351/g.156371  ORF Transcript_67351/g.156371 Transcript_67351/m.156371 type:complete len:890 (+) Transcript_67351:64-2733(+)|eukprot:CAMPEP_0171069538 /NCGR_PEP_ID=MMETSP0766_2-20121228/9202_1 /TAXON_ID=439317 /ORGANISM="Gambierdiscus australes, Strain CAWD 149" /LENGTH=889 /DNA_ID=CAMNT_0011525927 /DNA_START=50 /DNA_END=2719 /DNA_ORIENTATION=+
MASPRENDEDLFGEPDVRDEEEEEGEDLFGADMARDYEERPELDHYDPEMLDDAEHERLTIAQRLAAERDLDARDRREGRRRRELPGEQPGELPGEPAARLPPEISSPFPSSDIEPDFGGDTTVRRKRRRTEFMSPLSDHASEADVDAEEDIPPAYYDLNKEELPEGMALEKRLEQKIRRCFQQFLRKFVPEGQTEPKYPDMIQKMAEEHQQHLDVHFVHLQQWSAPLALWVADHPTMVLPLLNETLLEEAERKFGTYRQLREKEEHELRVAIHSFPVREPIRELNTKHLSKLVNVHGVVTKRSKVFNEVKRLYLRCAKCNYPSGPFDVAEEQDLKPGSCIECQSKGPWKVDRQKTLYQNFQRITLQESPSSVDPGKMPRSKEVTLTGDQVDSIRPGDELHLTGVYKCLYDVATNARTCFPVYRTLINAVHVHRKGDVNLFNITDEQQSEILELAKSPNIRERFIASMAPSIYGMWHVKTAIAMSMMGGQFKMTAGKHRIRGDINTLIVGDPGLAKSQFLKYVEQTFPRAVYTTGKGASAVGLTAAVQRDENGDWSLEGGAMVLADNGICLIDEFDKMNDQDRTSIHEAMEQQTISISKAGIVASLQARCSVIAVANPLEGRYDPQRTFAQNVNLSDPILSRFDVLCVLRDESDAVQDARLADHVVCSHIRSHPDASPDDKLIQPRTAQQRGPQQHRPIDQDLLQKYIVYARTRVHPKLGDIDQEKLANFYKDIRAEAFRSGGAPMTARHIDSIVRLSEASARMELREHVTNKDLDFAIGVLLESFIQSQKHAVAEELRQKFKRYMSQATPLSDQFMRLLQKLFKDKADLMRLSRPGTEEPEEVGVDMAEVAQQIERHDLDADTAHEFLRSDRFHSNFRLQGERIFRMV